MAIGQIERDEAAELAETRWKICDALATSHVQGAKRRILRNRRDFLEPLAICEVEDLEVGRAAQERRRQLAEALKAAVEAAQPRKSDARQSRHSGASAHIERVQ